MIRLLDVVLLSAAVAGAVWTYQIKHEAELSTNRVKELKAQISAQDRKIALLEADWALETGPARLEAIAHKYVEQLNLKPMQSSQIIDTSELPGLREDRKPVDEEIYAEEAEETLTGGIKDLLEQEGFN